MAATQMAFSEDLREAINVSGKTASELARECGVDRTVLSRFMRSERTITVETADRLADYFNLRLLPEPSVKPKLGRKPSR